MEYINNSVKSCANCSFFNNLVPKEEDLKMPSGECRKNSPDVFITPFAVYKDSLGYNQSAGGNQVTLFPKVTHKDWCGEFDNKHFSRKE